MENEFAVGDRVEKNTGYKFPGNIVAAFDARAGKRRCVVEFTGQDGEGLLHIFNGAQLTKR